ncbi:dihydrolipoamide acetyltransferase family protein [Citricoccus muralis]|uniref:Dihydrolipoamide acetyltransferase component of pyruvate dehydrogenase complex n=1 Tax=Citricoccus muralis TaxID=169134 RepID=A0ABY8H495_9MICC|nr:dihydrolipoamide acetyltransferase family protein [Citricoccus muralis]WFP15954.1 dihydrolipoamide acetyltransferase family protein [Citricoccus muralis]
MAQTFDLPDLGEGLTEAELVRWLVAEGDVVVVDQPIAEVETAKALVEVPCPYAGTVLTLHGAEGETMLVDAPLITVGDPEAATGKSTEQPGALSYREEEQAGVKPERGPGGDGAEGNADDEGSGSVLIGYGTTGAKATGRTRARKTSAPAPAALASTGASTGRAPRVISPLVRGLARRHGLDLAAVQGSGPDGLILRADVEAAVSAASSTTGAAAGAATVAAGAPVPSGEVDSRSGLAIAERIPVKGVRKMVAEQMVRSRRTIPEATAWLDVDVTKLVELRAELKAQDASAAPSLLALIARFTTAALQRYPVMNSRVVGEGDTGEEILHFDGINLGLAAQTDRGLVVPAIEHAEKLSARELNTAIAELVGKARDGKCTPAELTRGTFTLNNYGVFGTDGAAAIINAPEVAILGVGRIIDRPWVVEGEILVRKVTELTLSFDHRVTDGGTASAFLTMVARAMENPASALADL